MTALVIFSLWIIKEMPEQSGNCLISTSGLDDFRPKLSSLDKNRRRSRIDDNDSYTSELLATRLKDFRPNHSDSVESRRNNRKDDKNDRPSGVVALDLDWNRFCQNNQPRNSRLSGQAIDDNPEASRRHEDIFFDKNETRNGCSEGREAKQNLDHQDDDRSSERSVKNNGRPSMKHPTIVHGEITR